MAEIHVDAQGRQTVTKPGLPYKGLEGQKIEGFISNYFEGPVPEVVEEVARAFAQGYRDMGWWKVFCIAIVDDRDRRTILGWSVECIRTPGRHRAFKNACRRGKEKR